MNTTIIYSFLSAEEFHVACSLAFAFLLSSFCIIFSTLAVAIKVQQVFPSSPKENFRLWIGML
jgi:hypothetical protein